CLFYSVCTNVMSPANNQFSYTAQYGDYWLESTPLTTIQSTYRYSPFTTGYNLKPRQGFFNISNTIEQTCSSFPNFNNINSCPDRTVIGSGGAGPIKNLITQKEIDLENLVKLLDNDNSSYLKSIINQQPSMNNGQLKAELLAATPLSSEVLIVLINSNVSNGILKDVLIQNSPLGIDLLSTLINKSPSISPGILKNILEMNAPLSPFIINELNLISIPNGIMNQIMQYQNNQILNPSQTQLIEENIAVVNTEISRLKNDVIRVLLFDHALDKGYKEVADYISNTPLTNTNSDEQLLVNSLMANKEFSAAQQVLAQIHPNPVNADFCKLTNTLVACQAYPEKEDIIATNMTLQQPINDVAIAITNYQEVSAAQTLREATGVDTNTVEDVEIIIPQNGGIARGSSENSDDTEITETKEDVRVNLYPNPAKEQFSVTHNLVIENNVTVLKVYDLMGSALIIEQINANEVLINTETLKTGVYFYSITQNGVILKTDKLLIE
ncbi:MAG: T9SS type A sorting domain-containing protein, partial [Vicingaceae bacterium]|nr:T9SS type A sorting domain-containing protein [Vicingaceae bacterium]